MSKPMTMNELAKLMDHIKGCHSFCQAAAGQRHVKYIDPHIDTRDWVCFSVTFRGLGADVTLHTQNECRDLPESLYTRCMNWLDGVDAQPGDCQSKPAEYESEGHFRLKPDGQAELLKPSTLGD